MRKTILFGLMAAAVALAAPRSARACGGGGGPYWNGNYSGLIFAGLVIAGAVGTDAVLTVWDAGSVVASRELSRGYGIFETVVAAPQLALGIAAMAGSNDYNRGTYTWYTVWMGALAAHGVWTIATAPSSDAPPPEKARVALGPTYVPVGQFSHPGLGLKGRF